MTEPSSHAAFDLAGRHRKAKKIEALIAPWIAGRSGLRLLEIGAGSGAIAHYFASRPVRHDVCAIDVVDQRRVSEGYAFSTYDGVRLPFPDQSFDGIISNHVLEHVGNRPRQTQHLREIARILRNDGIVYVATPSRWQFIEPHFRLPGLSWIPRNLRDAYVRSFGRGLRYDCDPFAHSEFEELVTALGFKCSNVNVLAMRETFSHEHTRRLFVRVLACVPNKMLAHAYRFSPTMVYLLRKSSEVMLDAGSWS